MCVWNNHDREFIVVYLIGMFQKVSLRKGLASHDALLHSQFA